MHPDQIREHVELKVPAELIEDAQAGRGSIHCLAHIGNWEILSKVFTDQIPDGARFGAIFRPLDNEVANRYVLAQREKFGCEMFPKGTSIMRLTSFIRNQGHLGILADQRAGKKRKYARAFFGRESARSKLPVLLHKRTGARLYMVVCYSERAAKWNVEVSPVPVEDDDPEAILDAITAEFERIFRQHLIDVFWLHDYWKIKRKTESTPAN